jgi:hypothetical protein
LGDQDTMPVVHQILKAHPHATLSTIVGNVDIPLFADLRRFGITPKRLPVPSS